MKTTTPPKRTKRNADYSSFFDVEKTLEGAPAYVPFFEPDTGPIEKVCVTAVYIPCLEATVFRCPVCDAIHISGHHDCSGKARPGFSIFDHSTGKKRELADGWRFSVAIIKEVTRPAMLALAGDLTNWLDKKGFVWQLARNPGNGRPDGAKIAFANGDAEILQSIAEAANANR